MIKDNLKELQNEISHLKTDAAQLRLKLKEKFDVETLRKLEAKTARLAELERREATERRLKEKYRKQYLENSFASEDDFERLWNEGLRDKAIKENAENRADLAEVMSHSIYSTF